jgi:hypothetical protein
MLVFEPRMSQNVNLHDILTSIHSLMCPRAQVAKCTSIRPCLDVHPSPPQTSNSPSHTCPPTLSPPSVPGALITETKHIQGTRNTSTMDTVHTVMFLTCREVWSSMSLDVVYHRDLCRRLELRCNRTEGYILQSGCLPSTF